MEARSARILGGRPLEPVLADMRVLNKLSDDQFAELTDLALRFLVSKDWAALAEAVDAFAARHGANAALLRPCSKSLVLLAAEALRQNLGSAQVRRDLGSLSLDAAKAATLAERWAAAYSSRGARPNQLLDAQWKFGLTVASSEHELKSSFVQLKLCIEDRSAGDAPRDVHVEMSLPQFYSLCHEMEQAKRTLQSLHGS
ncbi:COMM domain-containing protein, putative [Ixodes scapularis]|uniref:COMM domain-containing protein, putative n=2 Tax=Ixodes scapularis TaxID=6945 RepID=B7Q021_IXOSC|nr:COMM domain-containing protein, putative [Ixodes scapularis]|eukprot:XP_002406733.1 COMM domain-containing protein, putative [Ixodes scapularis]